MKPAKAETFTATEVVMRMRRMQLKLSKVVSKLADEQIDMMFNVKRHKRWNRHDPSGAHGLDTQHLAEVRSALDRSFQQGKD